MRCDCYRCVAVFPCWDKSEIDAVSGNSGLKLHPGSEVHPSCSPFLLTAHFSLQQEEGETQ